MNVPNLARQILSDLWEFGRIVMILVAVLALHGFAISRREKDKKQSNTLSGLVLIGLSTVGVFCAFAFLNIQAGNILALMRKNLEWGVFTGVLMISLLMVGALTVCRKIALYRRETVISITKVGQAPKRTMTKVLKMSWLVVALMTLTSTFWLWELARG